LTKQLTLLVIYIVHDKVTNNVSIKLTVY
jgi:hypothetical protein